MTTQEGIILWKLLVAHLVTDFILQSKQGIANRKNKHYKSEWLYIHGLIAGVTSCVLLWNLNAWKISLFIAITHVIIDIWKSYKNDKLKFFLLDQFFHLIILFIAWLYFVKGFESFGDQFYGYANNFKIWVIGASYLMITFPFGILIEQATKKWRDELNGTKASGLDDAGKWIGIFERVIILTLILLNQYEAIGLLIAAKSILRFPETKDDDSLKRTEYVLVGTLISFGLTFLVGILIKALIN